MSSPTPGAAEVAALVEAVDVDGEVCLAFPRGRHGEARRRPASVDVAVPVFNGGGRLERCVGSALDQSLRDVRVIVVDNASTDDTFARACALALRDERVIVYQNARNVGRVPNWNRCIARMTATYGKLLTVNEVLLPSFAAELVAALEAQPGAAMARASLSIRGADGNVAFSPYFAESTFLPAAAARALSLTRDNVAGCPTAQLFRRALVDRLGLRFDERLSWAADYDFATRLFAHGGLAYVRKPLFVFDASAERFFRSGDAAARFGDECAVRARAARDGGTLDAATLAGAARAVDALFDAYAAQARSADERAQLERVRDDAQREIRSAKPRSTSAPPAVSPAAPPLVSVVIPCFKQAAFLPEAVESLVLQTFTDWECVIVDDGSPDDTAAVAAALAQRYAPRAIRLVRQENRGLSEARNSGIRASRGRYVLPFDADDRLAPAMLERLTGILESRPDVAIAYTHAQCFGVQTGVWTCGPFTVEALREANRIPYCSLYRRAVWEAVGGYNPNLDAFEDWDFWVGAAERGFRAEGTADLALFLYRTKAVSMLTQAAARRPQLTARLVLNHPGLFTPEQEASARAILPRGAPERRAPVVPAVSVVVLRREGGEAFARTLTSVLAQEYQDIEVIVVDDGDVPAGAEVDAVDRARRVHYLRPRRGAGRSFARNAGLRAARGRWVAYADEGDRVYADHLRVLVGALEDGGARVAYADAHLPGDPRTKNAAAPRRVALSAIANGDVFLPATRVPLVCLVHERALLDGVGDFDESLGALEDWDFQIRLLAASPALHAARVVAETGAKNRVHAAPADRDDPSAAASAGALLQRKHEALFRDAERRRGAPYEEAAAHARTLVAAGDVAGAVSVMEQCAAAVPHCASAHDHLASLYQATGKLGQALASIVAALELEPASPAFWERARAIERAVQAGRGSPSAQAVRRATAT